MIPWTHDHAYGYSPFVEDGFNRQRASPLDCKKSSFDRSKFRGSTLESGGVD